MKFVKLTEEHVQAWNDFCLENTWFWHTTHWQEYLQNSKIGVESKSHSFFIEQNGEMVGIVPLIQEGDQLVSPGFADRKEILQEVKRIALENGVKRIQIDCSIKGYLPIPGHTCIIDLSNISPTKGCRSAIKKAEKNLSCIDDYDINEYRNDYYRIAGKKTRPEITFDIMSNWVKQGYGTLLTATCGGAIAGHVFVVHWKDRAYYFASCAEPEFKEYNVGHYLQSKIFELLKKKGIKYYELGEIVYNTLFHQPTEKEYNISRFKKSFGGEVITNPRSEYFFDKLYFKEIMHDRINRYIDNEFKT